MTADANTTNVDWDARFAALVARAEAAEARAAERQDIIDSFVARVEAAEAERDQARDALRDMEKTLRDTEEQLGVWVSYVEANTDEQTSYTREVLAVARAALGDKSA